MNLDNLKFVKNIDDPKLWAYAAWKQDSNQHLHWSNVKGSEANARNLNRGDLVLLVQKPPHIAKTYATHLVKVIGADAEIIDDGDWGIRREVSVIWAADFAHEASIPTDKDIFGWKRHRAEGPRVGQLTNIKEGKILQLWHSLEIFQRHVAGMLGLTEE